MVSVTNRIGIILEVRYFQEKEKARDYYTDMLVKYPNATVEISKI